MSDPNPDSPQPPTTPPTTPPTAPPTAPPTVPPADAPAASGGGGAYPPPAYGAQPPYAAPPAYGAQSSYGGQPSYPAPAYTPYPTGPKTNALAIVSLIASIAGFVFLPFVGSVAGVITGHISLRQLKTSGENGRGMALAGTIVGWVGVAFSLIVGVVIVIWFVALFGTMGSYGYDSYSSLS